MAQTEEPVQRFHVGHISAAIWTNATSDVQGWFKVEVTRNCRDFESCEDPAAFRLQDLPFVALAAIMAYDWIWRNLLPAQPAPELERMPHTNGYMSRRPSGRK